MWLSHNRARRSTYGGERAEPLLPRRPLIPAPAAPESLKDRGPVRFQMRQRPSLRLHSAVRQYVRQFSSSLNMFTLIISIGIEGDGRFHLNARLAP